MNEKTHKGYTYKELMEKYFPEVEQKPRYELITKEYDCCCYPQDKNCHQCGGSGKFRTFIIKDNG